MKTKHKNPNNQTKPKNVNYFSFSLFYSEVLTEVAKSASVGLRKKKKKKKKLNKRQYVLELLLKSV